LPGCGRWLRHLVLLAFVFARASASAGEVADREVVSSASGNATWTNRNAYAAVNLERIWVYNSVLAANTVVVSRVCTDLGTTQAVGSVVCTSSAGNTASFTAEYMLPNDLLLFDGAADSNYTAMVEFTVQKH
jgi:hypothetical protein